jgi:putative ABC transport system permease protein
MLFYNVRIALKSLRRNPALTAVVIGAIALGICVSTTFVAMRHLLEKDPVPGKSHRIHYVRMDNWDPARPWSADDPESLPSQITYRDMRELMKSTIPTRQSGTFKATFFVHPDPKIGRPYNEMVRLVFSDFFTMFNIPFQYGAGWDKAADAKPEQVVVIDDATNERLFGGGNSVGKSIRLEDRNYKVVGVLAPWRPPVKFYDLTQSAVDKPEPFFMPFNLAPILQLRTSGNSDGWKGGGNTYEESLMSETVFIQFWVELATPERVAAYREFVDNYVREQKKLGRFPRPLYNRVDSMPDLFEDMKVVPTQVKAMSTVSLLFLAVCSLNLVGLLLGKFLARVPEVSVRRALGASRFQIFWQHVVECEVVGVIGGLLGLAASVGVLRLIAKVMPNGEAIGLDAEMMLISVFLSLVAGLLAGVYPAWRVCTVAPAMQLKVQ